MKLNWDKISNTTQIIIVALVIFSIFAGLSCVAAADIDASSINHDNSLDMNRVLTMTARYNAGTGYHWEVSPETHGVTLMTVKNIVDHPGTCGSSGTRIYKFLKQEKDYYVKLVYVSPSGEIVKEIDSNMLN